MQTFTIITDLRYAPATYSRNGSPLRGLTRTIKNATRHDVLAYQAMAKNCGAKFEFTRDMED